MYARSLAGAFVLGCCAQASAQSATESQTFLVHGTARSCGAITQLDSALASDSQQFFAGWSEKDYADAIAWSQACSKYGWHVPGRPRIPLLQAQRDKALRGGPPAAPAAQAAVTLSTQKEASVAPGIPLDTPTIQIKETQPEVSGDEHFHQEAVWVAQRAHLDIGADGGPSGWTSSGTPAQLANRLTADKIVLFCARKTNLGKNDKRPLLWDWRRCESEEASAYSRLVADNEFPAAGRGIVLGCTGADSYIYLERCIATMAAQSKP
jgi:hypothetical protein